MDRVSFMHLLISSKHHSQAMNKVFISTRSILISTSFRMALVAEISKIRNVSLYNSDICFIFRLQMIGMQSSVLNIDNCQTIFKKFSKPNLILNLMHCNYKKKYQDSESIVFILLEVITFTRDFNLL